MTQHFCFVYISADGGTLLQHNGANSPVNYDDDGTFDVNDQSKYFLRPEKKSHLFFLPLKALQIWENECE